MKKLVFPILLVCCSIASMGQSRTYDYLSIALRDMRTITVSTDSAMRVVVVELEKGDETALDRAIGSANERVLSFVQEQEAKGWELFTVYSSHNGSTWVMRKPKQ